MGFFAPKDPAEKAAERAREAELERTNQIQAGRKAIDENFASFDDAFFDARAQEFRDFQTPVLQDQFDDARRALTLSLARQQPAGSSSVARRLGDLNQRFAEQQARVENEAANLSNRFRADVDSQRSALLGQLNSSADASAAAQQSLSQAQALQVPTTFSPIENVFADLINSGATIAAAQQRGFQTPQLFNNPRLPGSTSSGSARVIN